MTAQRRRRAALAAVLVAPLVVLGACVPAPTEPTDPTVPTIPGQPEPHIASFTVSPTSSVAPALVALGWSVSDAQGDPLTCTLDKESDGTADVTLPGCQAIGSRNVTYPTAGSYTATLSVSDGTHVTTAQRPVTVSAGPTETFDIEIEFVGTLPPEAEAAFAAAEARWEQVLTRGIPAANVNAAAGSCLAGAGAVNRTVDDVLIQAKVVADDGPGGRLAFAGPCLIGTADKLPRLGRMSFDSADIAPLIANGTLDDVVMHEMGHVLGIGTVWSSLGLLSGGGTSDPRFTGSRAVAAWSSFNRSGTVPVEGDYGTGTRDSHWDEATFGNELMTGFISNFANPMSRLTISSMADLGYLVDVSVADAYSLPGAAAMAGEPHGFDLASSEVLLGPIGTT